MKSLVWVYAMAVAKEQEAAAHITPCSYAVERLEATRAAVRVIERAIASRLEGRFDTMAEDRFDTMAEVQPLAKAIREYALAFARERLAYRFGIGETAATNVARIKAQRELFSQLAK